MIDSRYEKIYKVALKDEIKKIERVKMIKDLMDYEKSTKPFNENQMSFFNDYPYFTFFEMSIPVFDIKNMRGTGNMDIHTYLNSMMSFMVYHYENTYKMDNAKEVLEYIRKLLDSTELKYSQSFIVFALETNFNKINDKRLELIENGLLEDDYDKDIFGTIKYYHDIHVNDLKNME